MIVCRRVDGRCPIEAVVRGYLAGSGWKDYQATGAVCGDPAARRPARERSAARADLHAGDQGRGRRARREHRLRRDGRAAVGGDASRRARRATCARARTRCGRRSRRAPGSSSPTRSSSSALRPATASCSSSTRSLTPDSSRFWDAATYEPGRPQASFDKQFVRDWLETQPWDKTAPGPALPDEVVAGTRARYVEAFERITGASFERYLTGGRHRPMSTLPVRRQRPAQARHPRPAGPGGGGQPRPPRHRRASAPSASAGGSS